MASAQVLTFHDGKLDVPEELQRDWRLAEGTELRVISGSSSAILLEQAPKTQKTASEVRALLDSLRGSIPDLRIPEQQAQARLRKQRAQENLDLVYALKTAGATEIKGAEREWELADDELDFGPFPDC